MDEAGKEKKLKKNLKGKYEGKASRMSQYQQEAYPHSSAISLTSPPRLPSPASFTLFSIPSAPLNIFSIPSAPLSFFNLFSAHLLITNTIIIQNHFSRLIEKLSKLHQNSIKIFENV